MTVAPAIDFLRHLDAIGITADDLRFDSGFHALTLQLAIPHQPRRMDGGNMRGAQLVLSDFFIDPATGGPEAAGFWARVTDFLTLVHPFLDHHVSRSDLRLMINLADGGVSGLLSFDRVAGCTTALFPDLYLLAAKRPDPSLTQHAFKQSFAARTSTLFWRGSTTGSFSGTYLQLLENPRVRACRTLADLAPGLCDCKVSRIVQAGGFDLDEASHDLRHRRLMANGVPEAEFGTYRSTLDLPGNSAAWGASYKYLAGCLVLRPPQPHELTYSDRLQAWEHYIPVASDLADLSERLAWIAADVDRAAGIAWRGRELLCDVVARLPQTVGAILQEQSRIGSAG